MSNINTNIKVLREEARLSVEEFAEKMNVSKETVVNWEKGKQDPTNEQIEQNNGFLYILFNYNTSSILYRLLII